MTLFPVVLSLCDRTGNWARPYAEAGFPVVTVDMQDAPAEHMYRGRHHIVSDIRLLTQAQLAAYGVVRGNVLAMLAAPPCTVLAYSGARWPRTAEQMALAYSLLAQCEAWAMRLEPKCWALENPAGKAQDVLGPPVAKFDPCDYGDPYTKQTWLWGRFTMPPMTPVEPTEGSKMHQLPPSVERANLRSATPMGFARAFCAANR